MSQEVYEIGKICQELAKDKGIELKEIKIPRQDITWGEFFDLNHSNPEIIVWKELEYWDVNAKTLENPIALKGENECYNFIYAGSQTKKPKQITSEALYIETAQRIITVIRGIKETRASIKIIDKTVMDVFKEFSNSEDLFKVEIPFNDLNNPLLEDEKLKKALEQYSDMGKIKKALEQLL